jgi:hypothetical protein
MIAERSRRPLFVGRNNWFVEATKAGERVSYIIRKSALGSYEHR